MVRPIHLVRFALGLLLLVAGQGRVPEAEGSVNAAASNLDRLVLAANDAADSLLGTFEAGDTVCLVVAGHSAAWVLEQALVERAPALGRVVRRCGSDEPGRVQAAVTTADVVYRAAPDDRFERTATIGFTAVVPSSTAGADRSTGLRSVRFSRSVIDTIDAADTAVVGRSGYDFTNGMLLDHDGGSFWSKVLEPAVVLAAAAIAAILLFTVRSQ